MASDENLYHKLLGLPEKLTEPTYFELFELQEGDATGPQVEEAYKKQIQKVQRFTNNPKYKEGALFIKGELRKARTALVDEGRRANYMRELLQKRTTGIRQVVRPLLIKGYIVDQEYQFLTSEAAKSRVPEAVVQQVVKQELEKKGIDPTTALVDSGGGVPGGYGAKSVIKQQPGAPQRKRGPMTLEARFPILRYVFEPSELFTAETGMAIVTFPLWLLGLKPSPPKPGQPQAGGLVFHSPFVAACLLFLGIGALAIPYGEADVLGYKAELDYVRSEKAGIESQREAWASEKAKLERQIAKLKKSGDGSVGGADPEVVEELKQQVATLTQERDEARKEVESLKGELASAKDTVETLKDLIKGGGSGGGPDEATEQQLKALKEENATLKQAKVKLEADLEAMQGSSTTQVGKLREQVTALEQERDATRAKMNAKFSDYFGGAVRPIAVKVGPGDEMVVGKVKVGGHKAKEVSIDLTLDDGLKPTDKLHVVRVTYIGQVAVDPKRLRPGKSTSWCVVTKTASEHDSVLTSDIVFKVSKREQ